MSKMLNIGHRGAMGHAPENTLASFSKALELGADCIELDVYLVEDKLLVFHDDTLDRTTNGQGLIMDQSLAYLQSLDAGEGEAIPTLAEVCDLVDGQAGLNIELKGPGTAKPVVDFIQSRLASGWNNSQFLVSSFDRDQLQVCRKHDKNILLGVLFHGPIADNLAFAQTINAFALHPSLPFTNQKMILSAHLQGLMVLVFTVNDNLDISRMKAFGADGVFTNYPEKVVKKQKRPLIPGFHSDSL